MIKVVRRRSDCTGVQYRFRRYLMLCSNVLTVPDHLPSRVARLLRKMVLQARRVQISNILYKSFLVQLKHRCFGMFKFVKNVRNGVLGNADVVVP